MNFNIHKHNWVPQFAILCLVVLCISCKPKEAKRPNILFISIDDLRPELGFMGSSGVHTPNLDKLSESSLFFSRAYAQEPTCGPSRASLLSGLRPNSTHVFDIFTPIRTVRPDVLTLPQHFKQNGYTTLSYGKIYHHPDEDDSLGWSEPAWKAELANLRGYINPDNTKRITKWGNSSFYEAMDIPDAAYEDGMTANKAIGALQKLKEDGNPFFLAVGFFKPHLPFIAPQKYWDLYDSATIELPNPYQMPNDRHVANFNFGGEISSYLDATRANRPWGYTGPDGIYEDSSYIFDDKTAKKLIHGYRASTSYADAQAGKVLNELERLGLRENTIVVVWSDHGWLLGELGDWCKHSLFEQQVKTTLMVSPPQYKGNQTDAIVEMVDIYPTLCELTGLPLPDHLEGKSIAQLLNEPKAPIAGKNTAFTQYPRDYYTRKGLVGKKYFQGFTVRTDRYRCTEWRLTSNLDSVVSRELYDYQKAPIELENVADDPTYEAVLQEHASLIEAHFLSETNKNNLAE